MDKQNDFEELKDEKIADTIESNESKEKNYHLLKKIFIENNNSNFPLLKNTKITIYFMQLFNHLLLLDMFVFLQDLNGF